MRRLVFLYLIFSMFFAYYSEPPLQEVLDYNLEHSKNLFTIDLYSTLEYEPDNLEELVKGNFSLISISPSIDKMVPSSEILYLFWTADFSIYETRPSFCGLKFVSNSIHYTITFSFKNYSNISSGNTPYLSEVPKAIQIPINTELLNQVQYDDNLSVELSWKIVSLFRDYSIIEIPPFGFTCAPGEEFEVITQGTDYLRYQVHGGENLYFLSKPVLFEQWKENNHFDSVLFSNRKFYHYSIIMNNTTIDSENIYFFDIIENSSGIRYVTSIENFSQNKNYSEFHDFFYPYPLEKQNNTFAFAYFFNYTYNGIGKNNLTLVLVDFFGNTHSFNSEITSKQFTHSGYYNNSEYYYPSIKYIKSDLNIAVLSLSFISLILLLIFIKNRN
ncbi:MAG: hypothetical protein PHU63_02470 [Candidatus ainarchaeum sp.]|nr:hypothetical protein [Candidatus ainarchaeum sp.]